MAFNFIINSDQNKYRNFTLSDGFLPGNRPSSKYNGIDDTTIVVFRSIGGPQDFLSTPQVWRVFYKVEVGDFIGVYEKKNGSTHLNSYKVVSINKDEITCIHAII